MSAFIRDTTNELTLKIHHMTLNNEDKKQKFMCKLGCDSSLESQCRAIQSELSHMQYQLKYLRSRPLYKQSSGRL